MENTQRVTALAYNFLRKNNGPADFYAIAENLQSNYSHKSSFNLEKFYGTLYTELILDPAFVLLSDNFWDLAERYKVDDLQKMFSKLAISDDHSETKPKRRRTTKKADKQITVKDK